MSRNIPLFFLLLSSPRLLSALQIEVFNRSNDSEPVKDFKDGDAFMEGRSCGLTTVPIVGLLIYPSPMNACTEVAPIPLSPEDNLTMIAYIPDYSTCPGINVRNLYRAGFRVILAYPNYGRIPCYEELALAIVKHNAAVYLEENVVISNYSSNKTYSLYLKVLDDYFYFYKKLMIIFGVILVAAILISIAVFCFIALCRYVCHKWCTRGLTRWRVHQLPRRKFRLSKEGSQTCSICLEDFKDREYVRVLPCDHVFHPSCVDEWLQKWNRTCPLCKSTISRRGGDEHTRLLHAESEPSLEPPSERGSREGYGATENTPRDEEEAGSPDVATVPTTESDPDPRSATAAAV